MLRLKDIVSNLDLEIFFGSALLERPVSGGYCGDLLSDVLANAPGGSIWITVQMHPNIAAVASLKELSGILLVNGRKPQPETMEKAEEEGIPIIGSRLPAFELAARLSRMLATGTA